jgi:hypothetical protein
MTVKRKKTGRVRKLVDTGQMENGLRRGRHASSVVRGRCVPGNQVAGMKTADATGLFVYTLLQQNQHKLRTRDRNFSPAKYFT